MRVEPNPPYFNKSIAQLEVLLEVPGLDINILRALEYELTQRKTARASKLHAKVLEVLETQPATQSGTPAGSAIVQAARLQSVPSASSSVTRLRSKGIPPIEDLGVLPVTKMPKGRNEPKGVIAAWTALEALSPQTYRRPEDMAGDRRCVAHLGGARLPWNAGERSRPKCCLYYQVILGAVSMARATEELVQTFGVDEEQNLRPPQEKTAIAAVLIDKNGIVVEENGIGVSSFAWALPLALKKRFDALGGWPSFEPKIIEKLDAIVRRFDPDGLALPLDLPTIERAMESKYSQANRI